MSNIIKRLDKWNSMYQSRVGSQWIPAEDVVRFCSRHILSRIGPRQYVERRQFGRLLDLGCGNGRHVVYFAQQGFEVSGVDISDEALSMCAEWLDLKGLHADIRHASVDKVPYSDNAFDTVISFGVLDHVLKDVALDAVKEAKRVLKPGGLLHFNLRSPEAYDYGKGEQLEPNTYILTDGPEKGIPQHFWSETEIEEALADFTILNWELQIRWLDKARTIKDARWAISAQL